MPLIPRSDGVYLKHLPLLRRMMPYIMPTRTESAVYFDQWVDVTGTLAWLSEQTDGGTRKRFSLFHVILAAAVRGISLRPGLHRFVVGKRIYQRKDLEISFAVRKKMDDRSTMTTVKVKFEAEDTLEDVARRVEEQVHVGRGDKDTTSEAEMRLLDYLPRFIVRAAFKAVRWLDYWNLLPGSMIKSDPLYASLFLANLGSVGIDAAYHHMYEHGTVPLFGAVGRVQKRPMVAADGTMEIRDMLLIRFTFDERINDGFYAARSLAFFRKLIEAPQQLMSPPSHARLESGDEGAEMVRPTRSTAQVGG